MICNLQALLYRNASLSVPPELLKSRSRPCCCFKLARSFITFEVRHTCVRTVIVKASSGPRYVVGCRNKVDKAKLIAGTRVALDMTTLTIMRALPREVKPARQYVAALAYLIGLLAPADFNAFAVQTLRATWCCTSSKGSSRM